MEKENIKYQYIVINISEERRNKTDELLNIVKNNVNSKNIPVKYIEASTIENSNIFLENLKDIVPDKRILCCFKSHLNAIKIAIQENSPEYSIILEDDVTFVKNNFSENIIEIINKWEKTEMYKNIDMIQIGWIPANNFEQYLNYETLDIINNLKVLYTFYAFGLQGYIVKKSNVLRSSLIQRLILAEKYNEINSILSVYSWYNYGLAADYVLNRILDFCIIFPPLIIERDELSFLNHDNKKYYWDKYFESNPNEKLKYF